MQKERLCLGMIPPTKAAENAAGKTASKSDPPSPEKHKDLKILGSAFGSMEVLQSAAGHSVSADSLKMGEHGSHPLTLNFARPAEALAHLRVLGAGTYSAERIIATRKRRPLIPANAKIPSPYPQDRLWLSHIPSLI